jgi:hypothetical protein
VANIYCLDASSLIYSRYYHPRSLAALWDLLDRLAREGRLISPHEVYREVSGQDDFAHDWAKKHKNIFVDVDIRQTELVREYQARFALLAKQAERTRPFADPWCLALTAIGNARGDKCYLVCEEKDTELASDKLPYLCRQLGLESVHLLDVPRLEGLRFTLTRAEETEIST